MKTLIATISFCLGLTIANAQDLKEADVPANIKHAFSKKYAGAKVDQWEKEGAEYEAEFHLNKVESSAVFTADGTFKELEQEIKISELPKTVTDYCSKNFLGHKFSEAAKITDANGKIMYEAELEKDKMTFDVIFDINGNFIKKSDTLKEEGKD